MFKLTRNIIAVLVLSAPIAAHAAPPPTGRTAADERSVPSEIGPRGASGTESREPFWQQNGAKIDRLRDRLFIGGAVENDGAYPNESKDWLAALQTAWGHPVGYTTGAVVNVLTGANPSASYALLGGAQTLNFNHNAAAIGTQGYGICNGLGGASSCWGLYGEAHRVAGTGSAYGMEVDPVGHIASTIPTPFHQGNLIGHQIACGGEYTRVRLYPCSAAIQIADNGAAFHTGINIMAGAIVASNPAIQLPTTNGIAFYDAAGHRGGTITADFSHGTTSNLNFTDHGLQVSGTDGTAVAYFSPGARSTSFLVFMGGTSDSSPRITAQGQDKDVELSLTGKGRGIVSVGAGLRLVPTSFAMLPPCDETRQGAIGYITDASDPIERWHQHVTAGKGTNKAFVACNGKGWFAFDY